MSRTNRAGEAASRLRQSSRPTEHVPDVLADGVAPMGASHPTHPSDPYLAQLHHLAQTITNIGAALGISRQRLVEGEAQERLEVVARLTVEQLGRCDGARVQAWFAAFADDLALDLRLDGQDPDMPTVAASLRAGNDPSDVLRTFQASAQSAAETQGDDVSVEARLAISKEHALALAREVVTQRAGVVAPALVAVYYAADAWNDLLCLASVPYLEQSGLMRADGRTCVLLCDATGYLAGAALECVGAALLSAPDWLPVSPAAFRQFVAREEASRRLLAEEGGWPDAPRVLTTEMLHLVARAPGLEGTAARLSTLRAELAAAALASVVQGKMTDGLTLRFAGVRPATCALSATSDTHEPDMVGDVLARLAEWATRRGTVDTLIIARECLARELPAAHGVTLAEVAKAAVDALEASKANFTLFIRGKTDRYFAARQAAQDAVANYAESVRKAVSDLTSDVVDNVYRTVGLLVAVVIAGLFQPAVSPWLALVASVLYIAYIAFVVYFLLRAHEDRFTLEQAALTARLDGMTELTVVEGQRIREPALSADAYYQRYMARTCGIYRALLALGVVVAVVFLVIALVYH